jgi:hypothetical protein
MLLIIRLFGIIYVYLRLEFKIIEARITFFYVYISHRCVCFFMLHRCVVEAALSYTLARSYIFQVLLQSPERINASLILS